MYICHSKNNNRFFKILHTTYFARKNPHPGPPLCYKCGEMLYAKLLAIVYYNNLAKITNFGKKNIYIQNSTPCISKHSISRPMFT